MVFVFDADILSTLIKTDVQELIPRLFPRGQFIIPRKVYQELDRGYFGKKKLSHLFHLSRSEIKEADEQAIQRLKIKQATLHTGELEALAIAKECTGVFLSNDKVALTTAKKHGITAKSMKEILLLTAEKQLLTKEQMKELLSAIETKDHTVVAGQEDILERYKS